MQRADAMPSRSGITTRVLLAVALTAGTWGCGETLLDHGADPQLLSLACGPELLACDGRCLSCSPPVNAHAVCVSGGCGIECEPGFNQCTPGSCAPETTTRCGPGCDDCTGTAPANAAPLCSGAHACDFQCNPGFLRGGGGCERARAVSAGFEHTCALTTGGRVKCWGSNEHGQLGVGSRIDSSVPLDVALPGPATAISAGYYHSCALVAGAVHCWGDNSFGEIGDGTTEDRLAPVSVPDLPAVSGVSAGGCGTEVPNTSFGHTCAVLTDGALRCWGSNGSGQLGDGSRRTRTRPVAVTVLPAGAVVSAVALGERHTCALAGGAVYCWGANDSAQLGIGALTGQTVPATPAVASGATAVAVGQNHACALAGGALRCWGLNSSSQVDPGPLATPDPVDSPVTPSIGPFAADLLAAGRAQTCVVNASASPATPRCFGSNRAGELGGTGNLVDVPLLEPATVSAVSAGAGHACVLTGDGGIQCWGENEYGQLGNGERGAVSSAPVRVSGR
jgi:alpha-tubulin suppressor-like RCC1 family protein